MPRPNDGLRSYQEKGVVKRHQIRELAPDQVINFCESNYITTWLNSIYLKNTHSGKKLQQVLERISQEANNGKCVGFGELPTYHFDKGYGHQQNVLTIPPNFKPFLDIVDHIAQHDMWFDLHSEPVTSDGKSYEVEIFGGLELIYKWNPNLKLIYSHTAMTNPQNARNILKHYPNVVMSIKIETKHNRWRNLEPVVSEAGDLYEDWAELFEEMPTRFLVGSDFHFDRKNVNPKKYVRKMRLFKKLLGSLKPEVAKLIAMDNAQRYFMGED